MLLCDIMTERHEITTMLQKAFSRIPSVFGELLQGSVREPAVVKESVHHFSKQVSGAPVKRPAWFFDVAQQGEGLVDITTHLVDLVQWECFPGEILDFAKDIRILGAKRWPTVIGPAQFAQVTQLPSYPDFLRKDVQADGNLHTYANGEIDYRIKGVHAKVSVLWNFEAPAGAGDTHFSVLRGSKANLVIRQGAGRGLATGPVHRARRERRRGGLCVRAGACAAPGARSVSRHRRRTHAATAGRSSFRRPTTSVTRPISRRSPESSSPAWRREPCPTGRCPA